MYRIIDTLTISGRKNHYLRQLNFRMVRRTNMIYVIRPKKELSKILGEEIEWFYTQPHAWETSEYIGTSLEPVGSTYPKLFMKLVFMLELINYTHHP